LGYKLSTIHILESGTGGFQREIGAFICVITSYLYTQRRCWRWRFI